MRVLANLSSAIIGGALLLAGFATQAQQLTQGVETIALRNGETAVLGELYWVTNCRSLLKGTPEAEIIDGPPSLTVQVKEAMVPARAMGCPNKVPGAIVTVTAKDIDDPSLSPVTVRIVYRTKDGDRQRSHIFNLSLIP